MTEVPRGLQGLGAEMGLVHVLCIDYILIDFQTTFVSLHLHLCHWYESIAWRRLISYNLDIVMLHISVIGMMI